MTEDHKTNEAVSQALFAADAAQEQHNAIWAPILAAHRVAAALRTIARDLPSLTAQASDPVYDLFEGAYASSDLTEAADALEKAAPLPNGPLTDEDRQVVFEMHYAMANDMSSKDNARAMLDQMTDADIAECVAQMALDELLDGE
jgi:hypothetical protein